MADAADDAKSLIEGLKRRQWLEMVLMAIIAPDAFTRFSVVPLCGKCRTKIIVMPWHNKICNRGNDLMPSE